VPRQEYVGVIPPLHPSASMACCGTALAFSDMEILLVDKIQAMSCNGEMFLNFFLVEAKEFD
jgi:hypothetical protein